jgi:hypothetical protein
MKKVKLYWIIGLSILALIVALIYFNIESFPLIRETIIGNTPLSSSSSTFGGGGP